MKTFAMAAFLLTCNACLAEPASQPVPQPARQPANQASAQPEYMLFSGMSDASAGVALDETHFVAGDDELNILGIYDVAKPGKPLSVLNLDQFLQAPVKKPEADIEAATRIGDRIYWCGSHGRNQNGKWREGRQRFFATDIVKAGGKFELRPVGKPCKILALAMAEAPSLQDLSLVKAIGTIKDDPTLAPKVQGLNIESIAASADGKTIYIGLRNPLVPSKAGNLQAIVVPLLNPAGVVDAGEKPRFGKPLLWNLKGSGLRDMTYSPTLKAYFISAGPADDSPGWRLYRWSGQEDQQPELVQSFDKHASHFHLEGIVFMPGTSRLLGLSDDGTIPVNVSGPAECLEEQYNSDGTCLNKSLRDRDKRTFRAMWLDIPASANP